MGMILPKEGLMSWYLVIGIMVAFVGLMFLIAKLHNRFVRTRPEDMEYINKDGTLRPQG